MVIIKSGFIKEFEVRDRFKGHDVLNVGSFLIKGTLFINNKVRSKCVFPCII